MASRPIKQDKDSKEAKVEQKSSKPKWALAIVSAMLLLGAGGGGAAWYFRTQDDSTAPKAKPPVFVSLETFTVNLQPEYSDQHLQTNLTLKVDDAATTDLIKLRMPEVRNRILLLLSSKTASEIATVEGKKKLASELAAEINQPFAEGSKDQSVESVLFTSFVIQ
jgi:flagellar FliL protein